MTHTNPARHLLTVTAMIALSFGCMMPLSRESGGYHSRDQELLDFPSPPRVFQPSGLGGSATTRPALRKICVAELGERDVPATVSQMLAGPSVRRPERHVVVLASEPFRPLRGDDLRAANIRGNELLVEVTRQLIFANQADAAPSPTTAPFRVLPVSGAFEDAFNRELIRSAEEPLFRLALVQLLHPEARPAKRRGATQPASAPIQITITPAQIAAVHDAFLHDRERQTDAQSEVEVQRLCRAAADQGADSLVLFTQAEWVDRADSTPLTFLDLLVVPAFILPSEYYHGEIAVCGWLIDPRTGQVFRTVAAKNRHLEVVPLVWVRENRELLLNRQYNRELSRVAEKLMGDQ